MPSGGKYECFPNPFGKAATNETPLNRISRHRTTESMLNSAYHYQLPWDDLAILIPVLAVLAAAAGIIATDAVQQQHGHVDDVKVGQETVETAGQTHGSRNEEVAGVVEVAGDT